MRFDSLLQRLPLQVLHDNIGRVVFQERVMNSHNVRRIETGDDARLLQHALLLQVEIPLLAVRHRNGGAVAHRSFRKQFLDGDRALQVSVRAQIGNAKAAFPQDPAQGEPSVLQVSACRQIAGRDRGRCTAGSAWSRTVGTQAVAGGTDGGTHEPISTKLKPCLTSGFPSCGANQRMGTLLTSPWVCT